ncbi:hypothetical protein C5167_033271 [Papaver somniferum]|uniref:CRM domain-containing protein n=1 Tax=Papaver somniferum TaxID=3469 RepID=A0A4Y7KDS6_PAPSO|nr:CRM-domain containing factor CFM3, chloroplastic/mitochondrial-like [Papaver somniferum]RZC70119.1 hypothetical protein C5167_033271 [Papaver somniferum]
MWAVSKTLRNVCPRLLANIVVESSSRLNTTTDHFLSPTKFSSCFNGDRTMSTSSRGRGMRSKVESLMRRDVGKTQREIRRARNLRKKLMTEEERLIWNLRRAKKKVALLQQRLKKYELPELPPPRHDPELLTPEQLQAYKKIGFRNRNYVPVGVRGVFGGVVQNMHLHWKFHETVQVCCDNFPKERIKEMATMLARLSGGIVINVHDVKTIIMFRGRNYRQPKMLIPVNTLTKRKALFKARFEQALESQKLNIKKIEQQLRRKGVNHEDPVAMASIQRVASTFFSAIDEKQGTPYVFHGDKQPVAKHDNREDDHPFAEKQEQKQLDKFIADIEEAAEQEWEAEEAAEKEHTFRMKYLNREKSEGRIRRMSGGDSEDESEGCGRRDWDDSDLSSSSRPRTRGTRKWDSDEDDNNVGSSGDDEWDHNDLHSGEDSSTEAVEEFKGSRTLNRKQNVNYTTDSREAYKRSDGLKPRGKVSESEGNLGDSEEESWDSGRAKQDMSYRAENKEAHKKLSGIRPRGGVSKEGSESEDILGDMEDAPWELDSDEEDNSTVAEQAGYEYLYSGGDEDYDSTKYQLGQTNVKPKTKAPNQVDETWDSD